MSCCKGFFVFVVSHFICFFATSTEPNAALKRNPEPCVMSLGEVLSSSNLAALARPPDYLLSSLGANWVVIVLSHNKANDPSGQDSVIVFNCKLSKVLHVLHGAQEDRLAVNIWTQCQFSFFFMIFIFSIFSQLCFYILNANVLCSFIRTHLDEGQPHLRIIWHDAIFHSNISKKTNVWESCYRAVIHTCMTYFVV